LGRTPELKVILVIAPVVFRVGKLPQIRKNTGKTIWNFRKAAEQKEETAITSRKPEE